MQAPKRTPPLLLHMPTTGSLVIGRSAGERSDPSLRRLRERARGDRQDAPRRQGTSGRQEGERPRAPSLERVPAAPLPSRLSLPRRDPPLPLLRLAPTGSPSRGVWADPQDNGATPLYVASRKGHEATVKTLLAAKAQVDAKAVSAPRAPSHERVPVAPLPSRLSLPRRALPLPLLRLPPTGPPSRGVWAAPQDGGTTPLYIASERGHEATVKTLLAAKAQVDAKRVSAPRTPSLERVPAAPLPSRLSLPRRAPPLPLLRLLHTGSPLSWGLGRSAGERIDPSLHRLTERARGDRQDAPRRQGASGCQDGERPPRAQPRARPGRAAPLPASPSSRPLPLLRLPPTGSPSRGVWADPQKDGSTPLSSHLFEDPISSLAERWVYPSYGCGFQ